MTHEPNWIKTAKKNAAKAAVNHVKDGFIVGLGSGTTVAIAIKELGKKIRKEQINILGVPTSFQSFLLATKYGVRTTTLDEKPLINLTIDGADQIDSQLNMIKGLGGALMREKIVAKSSKTNIIIADERKKVKNLGDYNHPVPIEVLPFAISFVKNQINKIGGKPILREGTGKVGPVITDNGNVIFDTNFGSIKNPKELNKTLKMITGVIETGLFIDSADIVYLGNATHTDKFERK